MDMIENRTFDEIEPGETASLVCTLSQDEMEHFVILSGDVSPAHVDEIYAKSALFQPIVAHGMWGTARISILLGTILPGPGTQYLDQTLHFRYPVALGDTITVTATALAKQAESHRITFDCACTNQRGEG